MPLFSAERRQERRENRQTRQEHRRQHRQERHQKRREKRHARLNSSKTSITSSCSSTSSSDYSSSEGDDSRTSTRWEKAVFSMNEIVEQVSQLDSDGVDVICFPGSIDAGEGGADYDVYRSIKGIKDLETLVAAHEPNGDCRMGEAIDVVLKEALDRGFDGRSCKVLVLTAGRPTDHEAVSKSLEEAAKKVKKDSDLTVTFVQVGDDEWATNYLKQLDTELVTTSANGKHIDIVDTIKDEDIQKAVEEMKDEKSSSGVMGGLVGAFAGAALGVGGVYLTNKVSKEKRTEGWNGRWKCIYQGNEMCVLDVIDDGHGKLEISGWDEGMTTMGSYAKDENGVTIQRSKLANEDEVISGTIVDEHTIEWDDGTWWEEVPPENAHWGAYAGAAVGGAAAAGATGYLLQKKFFNKASDNAKSDYVVVLDCSEMMAIPDTGK